MRKYVILFTISTAIFLVHFLKVKHGIYGDGNGYFSLTHTVFFQRSLNFEPIYNHLSHFQGVHYEFSRVFWNTTKTITGVYNNPWLVGTSLFWLPSFFVVSTLNFIFYFNLNMFSPLYEAGCGITGIILVLAGLYFLESYLMRRYERKVTLYTILTIFFSSQLFYYASFEPALSHQVSFFLVCLFLFFEKVEKHRHAVTFATGLTIGLLSITRTGDILLLLPLVLMKLVDWIRKKEYLDTALFIIAFGVSLLPQLLLQLNMYGDPFRNPYLQGEKGTIRLFSLFSITNHLISTKGGFLLWSPIYMLGLIGLVKIRRHQLSLIALGLFTLLVSSWESQVPAGFGNRFFISAMPLIAPGIAYFFKKYMRMAFTFSVIGFIWNAFLLSLFYF